MCTDAEALGDTMAKLTTAQEQEQFGWTTFGAVERKQILPCVHETDGVHITAVTVKTYLYPAVLPVQVKQEALLSQRGRAMLRVCIASIQNVERSLLLLVVSASDIPLRTIKFFSFFSLRRIRPCCRPSQTNIRWCVADCAIYTAWSSVTVFVTS